MNIKSVGDDRVSNRIPVSVMKVSKRSINKLWFDLAIIGLPPLTGQSLADPRNPNQPLNLCFEINIANRQRKQYESEMARKTVLNGYTTAPDPSFMPFACFSRSHSVGGVFLRAATNGTRHATNLNLYPTISVSSPARARLLVTFPLLQFQIPKALASGCWFLSVYILTESDIAGTHYVHASKGIFDHITPVQDQFGTIRNSKLVNPLKVELSPNDIRRGKYQ